MKISYWISAVLSLAGFTFSTPAQAAVWSGEGSDNQWSTSENWAGETLPTAGNPISFLSTGSRRDNTNDLAADTVYKSLSLGGNNYSLSGNSIGLSNGILSHQSAGSNFIDLPISLTGTQAFTVQHNGAWLHFESNADIFLDSFELSIGGLGSTSIESSLTGDQGSLAKIGPGLLRLANASTYNGGTVVSGGTLEVSNVTGSATGNGLVVIQNGAQLRGAGSIEGDVVLQPGAELFPGDHEPAILGVGNLLLGANSIFIVQLYGPAPGTEYSGLDVVGSVHLDGAIFRIALSPDLQVGDQFVVIENDADDEVVGTFANLPEGRTFRVIGFDDIGFEITYAGGDGNDVELTAIPTLSVDDVTVTEPASGTTTANFVVRLSASSAETITVKYATTPGTAIAGEDYTAASGTLTFGPGVTTQTVAVTVQADNVEEGNEQFYLHLFSPTKASIAKSEGVATITPPGTGGSGGGNGGGGSGSGNLPGGGGCSLDRSNPDFALSFLLLAPLALVWGWRRAKLRHS